MEPTAPSSKPEPSSGSPGRSDRTSEGYDTGRALMANHALGGFLERLHVQYADDRQIGQALLGAADELLDAAIDHQEPRDGVVGYLLPGEAHDDSWRYLCIACAPPEVRRIENRVYAGSEIADQGCCARCGQTLADAAAAA